MQIARLYRVRQAEIEKDVALFGVRGLQPQTRRKRLNALVHSTPQLSEMEKSHRVSRLSVHPRLGPRDSIFPGNPDLYRTVDTNATCSPYLQECVLAMEDCCEEVWHTLPIRNVLA